MGNVKGTAWVAVKEFLLKEYGADALERVLPKLTPEDRQIFSRPILPISWLDYGAYMRCMLTADRVLARGDHALVREASAYNARRDLRGIYKFFISFTNPQFIIRNAGRVWRQYYDQGEVVTERLEEKSGAFRITNWPDIPLHHELDQIPFIEEAIRISGGKNPKIIHDKCMARGDAYCHGHVRWE